MVLYRSWSTNTEVAVSTPVNTSNPFAIVAGSVLIATVYDHLGSVGTGINIPHSIPYLSPFVLQQSVVEPVTGISLKVYSAYFLPETVTGTSTTFSANLFTGTYYILEFFTGLDYTKPFKKSAPNAGTINFGGSSTGLEDTTSTWVPYSPSFTDKKLFHAYVASTLPGNVNTRFGIETRKAFPTYDPISAGGSSFGVSDSSGWWGTGASYDTSGSPDNIVDIPAWPVANTWNCKSFANASFLFNEAIQGVDKTLDDVSANSYAALRDPILEDIQYIGSASGTTTATIPTHQAGDLLIAYAFRDGNTTSPTLPTGWISINTGAGTTCSSRMAYRIATAPGTASGTWTNATSLGIAVYRNASGVGTAAVASGASNTLNWPAVTIPEGTGGKAWVVAGIGHRSVNATIETPRAGMINRLNVLDATDELSLHDTNGGVATFGTNTQTITGTASGWRAVCVALIPSKADEGYSYNSLDSFGLSSVLVLSDPIVGVSSTLDNVSANSSGTLLIKGSLLSSIGSVSVNSASKLLLKGSSSLTTANVSSTSAGRLSITGFSSVTIDNVSGSATATLMSGNAGTTNVTLTDVQSTSTGRLSIVGVASNTLTTALSATSELLIKGVASNSVSIGVSSTARLSIKGTSTSSIGNVSISATMGLTPLVATANNTLTSITGTLVGNLPIFGSFNKTIGDFTISSTGLVPVIAVSAMPVASITLSSEADIKDPTVVEVTLDSFTTSSTGKLFINASVSEVISVGINATGTLPIVSDVSGSISVGIKVKLLRNSFKPNTNVGTSVVHNQSSGSSNRPFENKTGSGENFIKRQTSGSNNSLYGNTSGASENKPYRR